MNHVSKKLAFLKVLKSTFIHPSLDALEELERQYSGKSLYSFSVDGIEYIIESVKHNCIYGVADQYSIWLCSAGIWHETSVSLYAWEWKFLVYGHSILNSELHFASTLHNNAEPTSPLILSNKELQAEIDKWTALIASDEASPTMLDYIKTMHVPVRINEDGKWIPTIKDVALS